MLIMSDTAKAVIKNNDYLKIAISTKIVIDMD